MTCIKTGAYIRVEPYGYTIPADLYQVNDIIIARMNNENCQSFDPADLEQVTHLVYLPTSSFYRPDIGIIVVPDNHVIPTAPKEQI